jgi:aspartate-semialdehyde dehydrogenase
MDLLSAELRIAVVGANTVEGEHLRRALASREIPGARVRYFGRADRQTVLEDEAGKAWLLEKTDPTAIAQHGVVFLCERDEPTLRALRASGCEALVVEVGSDPPEGRLVHRELRPMDSGEAGRFFSVPHGLAAILAELLAPLSRGPGLREAVGVVLRPAADFGKAGLEELHDQVVKLFRFEKPPTEVFGRQLAFNLIPEPLLPGSGGRLERRVRDEVAELLGWPVPRLSVRLVSAPIFHGHGIALRVALERPAAVAEIAASYQGVRSISLSGAAGAATPLDCGEGRHTSIAEIVEDGLGGFWIWAVASEAGAAAAEEAVELAQGLVQREGKRTP